jgi:hypothetical protein
MRRITIFLGVWLGIAIIAGLFFALFGGIIEFILVGVFYRWKLTASLFQILTWEYFQSSLVGIPITEMVLGDNIACHPAGYFCFFSPTLLLAVFCGFLLTESRLSLSYLINTPARLVQRGPDGRFRVGDEINMTVINIFEARRIPNPNYFQTLIKNIFLSIAFLFLIFFIGLLVIVFVVTLVGTLTDFSPAPGIKVKTPI